MNLLDVRTVMFNGLVTYALCSLVIAFLWIQNRRRFAGIGFWALDFACQTLGVALILLRGLVPDVLSMGLSNTLIVTGSFLGYAGLSAFLESKIRYVRNIAYLLVFIVVHLYFVLVDPNLAARNMNVSIGLLFMCAQSVRLVLHRVDEDRRKLSWPVGAIYLAFCLVSIVRIVAILLIHPTNNDFFRSGAYDTLLLMGYQVLLVALTFALVLMVNQRLKQDIRDEEGKFSTAFRSSPYALTLSRLADGRLLDANRSFEEITGYRLEEVVGRSTIELGLWASIADRDGVVSTLSRGEHVRGRETRFRIKGGGEIIGDFSAEIIAIRGEPWVLSSIVDITERRRGEEEQRLQAERFATELERRVAERTAQLGASNKELESFANSLSHDLRSPLRAVDGFSRIILEDYGDRMDEEGRRLCSTIGESAGDMGRLIDDLLEFSRLGRVSMQAQRVDMDTLARQVFEELVGPIGKEGVDYRIDPLPDALGDPSMLRQAWTQLLGNALKFSSGRERGFVEVGGEVRDGEAVYSVRDNGFGFDMRYVDKLFGLFQRLHGPEEFKGRGLGLATVHRIVGRHGGRVWAEGQLDQGAVFRFALPAWPNPHCSHLLNN